MVGPLSNAASYDDFVSSPRSKARDSILIAAIVLAFGSLAFAATIAMIAAADLVSASIHDSRTSGVQVAALTAADDNVTSEDAAPAAESSSTVGKASASEPERETRAFSSYFNTPTFLSGAKVGSQSNMLGSADRLPPALTASYAPLEFYPDLGLRSHVSADANNDATQAAAALDVPDAPRLPRRRERTDAPAMALAPGMVLASAQPEISDPALAPKTELPKTDTPTLPTPGSHTALYDIEGRVVYMPNGEKLEAHSGLGDMLDDTRYVGEKNRGPTPPHVYDLRLRESLFHGVQAVRLNPVGGRNPLGRVGLLAHPYMLGPNGDSNGCVSVKDYPKFLAAVQKGEITRLVVVKRVGDAPPVAVASGIGSFLRYAFGGL
jgi:hypothetical protein